ncbi:MULTISPECIES: type IV pilus twitching motility protein PilT [unclassified Fusibacter]|uniref:type IV pilus twitching motility protein PilT n=1 Tax=unclassified Fusibacter TaxID=2624464 RepID=UPI0010123F85|nr:MULTISPECIES: type IV pilus twitching motility protein PilT [unclassified Fusibacter]MCK8058898.1 type IV pilus twitching motility protein PilT [Fusibacter sp. A2]NPE21972.1 type IV pilus twitching motility protein PilT [Fusibacter sp. A1]RXV61540.1 type IV pilus twitching motility protein PilT [Fusibacter sp. A1]
MTIDSILKSAADKGASDVHLAVGNPVTIRIDGELIPASDDVLSADQTHAFAKHVIPSYKYTEFENKGQLDVSYRIDNHSAYRINIFRYSSKIGLACRIITEDIPTIEELDLPESIAKVSNYNAGLIIVTGPTGCGKSTTIAAIIDAINSRSKKHILTIEDPIEYIHKNKQSIITQREVGRDCETFSDALRAGLRQDPDIIMVGEMRDLETISTAVTAAETGHLVLGTLHTRNTYQTIERMIDVFPSTHQQQIRVQLANSLMAVFSQRLVPRKNGTGRIASVESMIVTPAIRNLMRENKVHQLHTFIQTGQRSGMQTFDDNLKQLYKTNIIDRETLLEYATDRENILK